MKCFFFLITVYYLSGYRECKRFWERMFSTWPALGKHIKTILGIFIQIPRQEQLEWNCPRFGGCSLRQLWSSGSTSSLPNTHRKQKHFPSHDPHISYYSTNALPFLHPSALLGMKEAKDQARAKDSDEDTLIMSPHNCVMWSGFGCFSIIALP